MAQQGRMPSADFSYVKRMPGLAVAVQLVSCFFAFILSMGTMSTYYVSSGHGFFIFVTFLAMSSCILWLLVRVFHFNTLLPANFDWNLAGLVHNGVFGFLVMVVSCVLVDRAKAAHVLMAAGVFGFFGFTGFVTALVFEASIWYQGRRSTSRMATATVVQGPEREEDAESRQSSGDAEDGLVPGLAGDGGNIEPHGSYAARPTSSFVDERQW